jgi:hypothetical protein
MARKKRPHHSDHGNFGHGVADAPSGRIEMLQDQKSFSAPFSLVIPAQAGINSSGRGMSAGWIPAFAG